MKTIRNALGYVFGFCLLLLLLAAAIQPLLPYLFALLMAAGILGVATRGRY